MSPRRRRSRSGFPIAVAIAALLALVAGRNAYTTQIAQAEARRSARPTTPEAVDVTPDATPAAATAGPRSGKGFTTRQHLVEHFEKHGAEFPGLDMTGYLRAAQLLRDAPAGGDILELRRSDGVVTRFDRKSGAFIAVNRDGTIRTFFRPNDGERYFRRQASRAPGGGP